MKILKKEAKELRKEITAIVDKSKMDFDPRVELQITVEIHEDWYNKEGGIKKKDISNREKFLIDSVFKALGVDDKNIFKSTFIKRFGEPHKAVIKIKEYVFD